MIRNRKWDEVQTCAVDRHVGQRLRALRISRRHSILHLGTLMGLSEFELARIENGTRRLSIPELWTLTRIYNVEPRFFYRAYRHQDYKLETH